MRARPSSRRAPWPCLGVVLATAVLGTGCDHGLPTMGMLGIPTMGRVAANIFLVDASVDGTPGGRLLADTGSPFTLLDPTVFGVAPSSDAQPKLDLTFGALTIDDVPTIEVMAPSPTLAGIVGGDVMRQFSMSFDYRDQTLRFGDGDGPTDVAQPGASVSFDLQGGGRGQLTASTTISFPATRIILTATIEGVDHTLMLDTGASETALRTSVFAQLAGDGRPMLDGLPITTVSGGTSAQALRTREIVVGGEAVDDSVAIQIGDDLFDNISTEIGHPIDGVVGGTFLREFLLTIDYAGRTVHLQRWNDRSHIVDEFHRVGVSLDGGVDGTYHAAAVYAGSDAATAGLSVGDEILSVDGTTLTSVDAIAADLLLTGAIGDTRMLGLGQTATGALSGRTIAVRVEDLIPPP